MNNQTSTSHDTYTYIGRPLDTRCAWWSAIIPATIGEDSLTDKVAMPYLKKGADLELVEGTMIIDSEAMHHKNQRGYRVNIGVVVRDLDGTLSLEWIAPTMEIKKYIKSHGHKKLMVGSGDVAACFRIALYLRSCECMYEELKKINSL